MRIDVDRLLSEGWYIYSLGNDDVLAPPKDSEYFHKAARVDHTTYKGKALHFFKYKGFPWDDYLRQDTE